MRDTKHKQFKNNKEQIRTMISITGCNLDHSTLPSPEGSQLKKPNSGWIR